MFVRRGVGSAATYPVVTKNVPGKKAGWVGRDERTNSCSVCGVGTRELE